MKLEQIIKLRLNNFEITPPDIVKKEKEAQKKSLNPTDMIEPNPCWEGYEAIGTKIVDGKEVPNCVPIKENQSKVNLAEYPWDKCITDQMERYGDMEIAKRVCGSIKAIYGSKITLKENFVIPNPEGGEDQNTFISRCVKNIIDEYPQEQALGICYSQWEKK